MVFVDELHVGALDLAAPLDVDQLRTVHHDLGDARVVQEAVDRPVAERVVGDVLDELGPLGGRERGVLVAQRLVDLLLHEAPELVLFDVVVGELRADLVDHELVDAQAQLFDLRRPRRVARLPLQVLPAGVLLRHDVRPPVRYRRQPRRRGSAGTSGSAMTGPGSGVEYRSASARSASAAGDRGLVEHDRNAAVDRLRDRDVGGMRNSAETPSARSTSLMSR